MKTFEKLIQNVYFFEGYEQKDIELLAPLFKERRFTKGNILFLEGDLGEECYLIKSGVVKIFRMDEVREITLALLRKGDYFGEMAMMQKGLTRSATAEVIESGIIYSLKRTDFLHFLENNPKMSIKLLEETMERLRNANDQIYDLTFRDLKSRLIKIIMRLAEEHGVHSQKGIIIPFKLTHQQLANMVGAIRESVSKLLQEIQEEQVISIENKIVTVLKRD
ncbi:Crp/Fnr family transcriptional regulator [Paenibacillus andongensis]|uniref:Crp/Fnr family transcriptional regulator n=1 Tax=Paenibacillus andongensis TaxID=2975482 RepID=UPI0021BAAFA8|nr:Crp/Fnr family transcriptional regulator [Paenibacillus andongensis]